MLDEIWEKFLEEKLSLQFIERRDVTEEAEALLSPSGT
jgi:hypothetical protein